jgi:hypothetical protein
VDEPNAERGSLTGKTDFELRIEAVVRAVLANELSRILDSLSSKDKAQDARLDTLWTEIIAIKESVNSHAGVVGDIPSLRDAIASNAKLLFEWDEEWKLRIQAALRAIEDYKVSRAEDRATLIEVSKIGGRYGGWETRLKLLEDTSAEKKKSDTAVTLAQLDSKTKILLALIGGLMTIGTAIITKLLAP